jgi:hypothetical protein
MGRTRVLVGAGALLLLTPLVAAAQGLGDAAKKEKARREQPKAPEAKTYTQDDLATLPPVANEPAPAERSSGAGEGARQSDENVWRGSVARAMARVERARQGYQTLAGMNLVPGYEYQDEKGRTVIQSVDELQHTTAAAKAELDAAEKALADLRERARRAGIPPGWLR